MVSQIMHVFGVHSLFCFRKLKFENIGVMNAVIGDRFHPTESLLDQFNQTNAKMKMQSLCHMWIKI